MPLPYHHGNLREALVDEALALARTDGPDGLSLREVARRAGVSHNAAYRHFADRDALLAAVASRGLSALVDAMRERQGRVRTRDPVTRAWRRLDEIGRAYVGFALAEPGLFALTFTQYPSLADHPAELDADPFGVLNQTLDDLVAAGAVTRARREGAEMLCWSAVHGFAVLHLDGPMQGRPARDRERDLDLVIGLIDHGLGAGDR